MRQYILSNGGGMVTEIKICLLYVLIVLLFWGDSACTLFGLLSGVLLNKESIHSYIIYIYVSSISIEGLRGVTKTKQTSITISVSSYKIVYLLSREMPSTATSYLATSITAGGIIASLALWSIRRKQKSDGR